MSKWSPTKLSDLIDIKHGYAFQGEYFKDEPSKDVLLTPGNFAVVGGFQWGKKKFYSGPVLEEFVLSPGDLIVTMTDLSKHADTLGFAAIVPNTELRLLHNQRIGKAVFKSDKATKSFLHWLMRSRDYRNEVLASLTGSTVKHTSPTKITAFEFLLPPRYEQEQIAGLLDALESKMKINRLTNDTLESLARGLFKDWFVNFGPSHAKAAGKPAYLATNIWELFPRDFDSNQKPLGWNELGLLDCARLISGGTPKTDIPAYWDGTIPWASAKDVSQCGEMFLIETNRSITELGLNESATRIVSKYGTVIVARGATTGRFCMLGRDTAINQTCYALEGKDQNPYWLNCAVASVMAGLVHAAHGSVFDTITTRTIENARLVVASPELITTFEKTVSPLFARILSNIEETSSLARIRDLLLPKLISGQVKLRAAGETIRRAK